jgi:glycosyltransferase involved in cell wall biosynthesis
MSRFAIIGPTYPYRGGIAHYTTLLAQHLRQKHETLLISFKRQYPQWLFPGQSDKDPSNQPLQTEAEHLLDPLNPLTWWHTLRRLENWRPDAVIMQWWHPYWSPTWSFLGRGIRRRSKQMPLIYLCHNVLPHENEGRLNQTVLPHLIRMTLRPATGFVTHSQVDRQILAELLPNHAIAVSPLPTYMALGGHANVDLPISVPEDCPLLLFAGFVRPYKGLDILLEAIALVKRPLHLLVAGEFWQGTTIYEEQITRLGIADRVTLHNEYLPNEVLAAYLKKANVVVLPYLSATQSAVVQLAFGHNCPVITTNVGGLAEVVIDGKTGLVVPPGDSSALARAIERYLAEDLESLFQKEIKIENRRFSWDCLQKTILRLISSHENCPYSDPKPG